MVLKIGRQKFIQVRSRQTTIIYIRCRITTTIIITTAITCTTMQCKSEQNTFKARIVMECAIQMGIRLMRKCEGFLARKTPKIKCVLLKLVFVTL